MDVAISDCENLHMDVARVDSLVVKVVEDLYDTVDLYVLDFSMVDMAKDIHVALVVDLGLHVSDLALELHGVAMMDFMFEDNASCHKL